MKTKYFTSINNRCVFFLAIVVMSLMSILGCSPLQQGGEQSPNEGVTSTQSQTKALKMAMIASMKDIIDNDNELSPEIKKSIADMAFSPLKTNMDIDISAPDVTARPIAVNLQKAFEQSVIMMLDSGKVANVIAIIHTPMPTTPLCNQPGETFEDSLHPSMVADGSRKKTIQDRTVTLRKMARHGDGLALYIVYLKNGLNKRAPKERDIYNKERSDSNNVSLHDSPLSSTKMSDEIVGASYILKTADGSLLFFGCKGYQAKEPADGNGVWKCWFGDLNEESPRSRYNKVFADLKAGGLSIPVFNDSPRPDPVQ